MENFGYRAGAERLETMYREALAEGNLSLSEKIRATATSYTTGYCRSLYRSIKWRLKYLFSK